MAKSVILSSSWWDAQPPAELAGAACVASVPFDQTMTTTYITYIGSSVFVVSSTLTRRYDLDSQMRVGAYVTAIAKKMSERAQLYNFIIDGSAVQVQPFRFINVGALAKNAGRTGVPRSYPPVWANGPFTGAILLDPSKPLEAQMGEDDDLINILAGKPSKGPATEPDPPAQRVAETSPDDKRVPPHRRSILKNLRPAKEYIASLMKG